MSDASDKSERKNARHKASMQKQKANVDAHIEAADLERGIALLITGNGNAIKIKPRLTKTVLVIFFVASAGVR